MCRLFKFQQEDFYGQNVLLPEEASTNQEGSRWSTVDSSNLRSMSKESDDLGAQKLWATYSLERLDRALRQLKRLQTAFAGEQREFGRVMEQNGGSPPQPLPSSWGRLHVRYQDELYFFILAARQALSVVPVMRQLDPDFPEIRQAEQVRHWRDIEEHWEDPALGKTLRAMSKWRDISEDSEPKLTLGARGHKLSTVSGVKLKQFKRDLKRARDVTARIEDRLWLHLYITADEAASILDIEVSELLRLKLHRFPEFEEEGGGLRFFREQVEWFRDTGSNMPDSWRRQESGL